MKIRTAKKIMTIVNLDIKHGHKRKTWINAIERCKKATKTFGSPIRTSKEWSYTHY